MREQQIGPFRLDEVTDTVKCNHVDVEECSCYRGRISGYDDDLRPIDCDARQKHKIDQWENLWYGLKDQRTPFYITVAENMPGGSGYYTLYAFTEADARTGAFDYLPHGRWAFLYRDLQSIHPADRIRHHGEVIVP